MTLSSSALQKVQDLATSIISLIPTDVSELTDSQNTAFTPKTHTHANMELTTNKSSSISTDTGSTTKYPTVDAVEDYVSDMIGDAITYINQ